MPTPTQARKAQDSATRRQLLTAVQACEDKKGEDTRILELDPADSGLADFFLITSASNDRQVVAIADEIEYRLKQDYGLYATSVEGRKQGRVDPPRLHRHRHPRLPPGKTRLLRHRTPQKIRHPPNSRTNRIKTQI